MSEKYTKETAHDFNTGETEVNIVQGERLVAHSDGRASMLVLGAIEELNDLQSQLAAAHARVEALEAEIEAQRPSRRVIALKRTNEALQAENARLQQLLETYSRDFPQINPSLSASGYQWLIDKAQGYDTTTPEPEPMWCPVEHPYHSDKWTARILRSDKYQYDTQSYDNPYEFEEDAWNRADELNASDS